MKANLIKIKDLENAEYPNNIPEGDIVQGEVYEMPKEGECFIIARSVSSGRRTSPVQKIIEQRSDFCLFETINSLYKLEILES